ncbi:hypothetical protein HPB47_000396 [Ixodes persulcatus]|uniref:Uncharacterized protein n=1 Tax=Ixodes persulcatus TaxID=34615 RepID=A0AC60PTI4_IXOPE|nr:hypothetical protein HPB47_000396 [Ixodes persulcatus]
MASRGTYRPPKDLKTKVKTLQEVDQGPMGLPPGYVPVMESTLSTYIKDREAIFAGYEKEHKPSRKSPRTSVHPQLEDALIMWIKQERHGLTFKTVCGEKADVDRARCEEWLSGELKDCLASFSLDPEAIANCFRKCGFGKPAAGGDVEEAAQHSSPDDCFPDSASGIKNQCGLKPTTNHATRSGAANGNEAKSCLAGDKSEGFEGDGQRPEEKEGTAHFELAPSTISTTLSARKTIEVCYANTVLNPDVEEALFSWFKDIRA